MCSCGGASLLTFSFLVSLNTVAGEGPQAFIVCEGRTETLECTDALISISRDSFSYGRTTVANTCLMADYPIHQNCTAKSSRVLQVLDELCHRKPKCNIVPSDELFDLTPCDGEEARNVDDSQLLFFYSCRKADEWESITEQAAATTSSLPDTTCVSGETRVQGCDVFSCVHEVWEKAYVDRENPDCCQFWAAGCSSLTTSNRLEQPGSLTRRPGPSGLDVQPSSTPISFTEPTRRNRKFPTKCPSKVSGPPFNIMWPETYAGIMKAARCPGDNRAVPKMARWKCSESGEWLGEPDTGSCASAAVLRLVDKVEAGNLTEFSASLANVTSSDDLLSGDIETVADIIREITQAIPVEGSHASGEILNITKNVFTAGNNLLSKANADVWNSINVTERPSAAMGLASALESLAIEAATSVEKDILLKQSNIALNVRVVKLKDVQGTDNITIQTDKAIVDFPVSNLVRYSPDSEYGKLVTVFYDRSDIWSAQADRIVNSKVFSASVVDSSSQNARRQLESPFVYTLWHEKSAQAKLHSCVYWEDSGESEWSGDGCRQIAGTVDYSVCECEHLTNFAVLLDVTGITKEISFGHILSLKIITYAGCAISIFCLLLSWLTFQCLKNLSSDRNTIHKNLVFTLMLAESLFLVAIAEPVVNTTILCSVIAGILHFLFLAVFAWTCLEGIQLYIMLIEVFEAEKSRTLYYYIAGYGLPTLVVGISSAVDYSGYGTATVCWLKTSTGFIWAFAGPVAGVLLVNMVMLGVAIYMMFKHANMVASMKHKETKKIDSINNLVDKKAWVKGSVVLVVLLGLTWVFGFMYISKDTLVMAYIFTVLNSLQGLFIFIFHCVGNEKVQKEYKKFVRRTSWLPKCFRVHYGEHRGLSNTISNSSNSAGYFSKFITRRRKSTDMTSGSRPGSMKKKPYSQYDESTMSKEPLTSRLSSPPTTPASNAKKQALMLNMEEHSNNNSSC